MGHYPSSVKELSMAQAKTQRGDQLKLVAFLSDPLRLSAFAVNYLQEK